MKTSFKTIVVVALILISFSLWAKKETPEINPRINELFALLSKENVNFDPTGTVCERVAEHELRHVYPEKQYQIVNSIQYGKREIIGELDIVVIDRKTNMVEAVGEVKCWKSFKGGLKKAREQRMRFQSNLNYNIFLIDKDKKKYPKSQFEQIRTYFTIAQSGGTQQGFDMELSLDLKELMYLRNELLDCRSEGRCPVR